MFCLAGFKKQVLNKHHPQTKFLYLLSSCKSYIKTEAKNLANVTALFQENTINWLWENLPATLVKTIVQFALF